MISTAPDGPRLEYSRRLAQRQELVRQTERREAWAGRGRVVAFGVALLIAALAFGPGWLSPAWLVLPLATFAVTTFCHDRWLEQRGRTRRAVAFYQRALALLGEGWSGGGESGLRFVPEHHLYARDLDLFGAGSVFERLNRARTRAGEQRLASWLLNPATPAEVRQRQEAVKELQPRLDLREDLHLRAGVVRDAVDAEGLASWGTEAAALPLAWARPVAWILSGMTLISLIGWIVAGWARPFFLAALILQLIFTIVVRARVARVIAAVDRRTRDLLALASLLDRLEREPFTTAGLRQVIHVLRENGARPGARIARLGRLVAQLDWSHNQIFSLLAALLMWTTHHALAIDGWRVRWGAAIGRWVEALADFEAIASLAAYAFESSADMFPEIMEGGPVFDAEALGHPLLPADRCVCNDVCLDSGMQLLVVSGSNMSGKSTLLRTVGVAAVLALAGAPVRAHRLQLSPVSLGATLRVEDSLRDGYSRFYAEVTRIRDLVERARTRPPLLFLIDEIFQGTNSHDRRLGAEAVIVGLANIGAIGVITTHDLALTHIVERLSPKARNVHFEDRFENGRMVFDYRMRLGVVRNSNALAIMRAVGLDVPAPGEAPSISLSRDAASGRP